MQLNENNHNAKIITNWIDQMVISQNLCPFAKKVFSDSSIRYKVSEAQNNEDLFLDFVKELHILEHDPEVSTTLLIQSDVSEFDHFLNMVEIFELYLEDNYFDIFQLATFHPDYVFEGSDFNDIGNFTNRSPFPIFQILRAKMIRDSLKNFNHPEKIPENNIRRLHKIGIDNIKKILSDCHNIQ